MSHFRKENSSTRSVKNLDDIPSPYLSGVFDLSETASVEIVMARGCSQNCAYCAICESPLRYFSYERIRDEINYISEHAPKLKDILVTVADMYENVPLGEKVLPLLKELAEKRHVRVLFYVNVSTLKNESLVKLSNCEYFDIEVGIQSLNPNVLTTCHIMPDPDKIRRNVARLKELAPKAQVYLGLISFLPGDTPESYWETLDWAISTETNAAVNHLRIIPCTELYERCAAKGMKVSPEYPYFVTETDTMPEKTVSLISRMTSQVFFALKAISMSPAIKKAFFSIAKKMNKDIPYVSLALLFTKMAISSPETKSAYEGFLKKFKQTKSLDHDLRTSSLSDEEISLLEEKFSLLAKMILSKSGKNQD